MASQEVKQIPKITLKVDKNCQIFKFSSTGEARQQLEHCALTELWSTAVDAPQRRHWPGVQGRNQHSMASLGGNYFYKSLVLLVCRMMVSGRPVPLRNSVGKGEGWAGGTVGPQEEGKDHSGSTKHGRTHTPFSEWGWLSPALLIVSYKQRTFSRK